MQQLRDYFGATAFFAFFFLAAFFGFEAVVFSTLAAGAAGAALAGAAAAGVAGAGAWADADVANIMADDSASAAMVVDNRVRICIFLGVVEQRFRGG